jgi:hypothetical protein
MVALKNIDFRAQHHPNFDWEAPNWFQTKKPMSCVMRDVPFLFPFVRLACSW